MSKKDPAFLFYSKDWIQGTAKLFPDEKGVYIDLLAHQHQDGYLPKDERRLAKIAGISDETFLKIWAEIKDKFHEKDGKLYNKKLISVTEDRAEHGEMRAIIGTFGQLLKNTICSDEEKTQIRKHFDYEAYLGTEKANLSTLLSKFISNCLTNGEANIGIGIGIGNANINGVKEGGTGGIIDENLWTSEKNSFLNGGGWIFKFCTDKKISSDQFDELAKEFISDIELKEDLKTAKELRSHFTNWYNLKVKKNGKGFKHHEQPAGSDLRKEVNAEFNRRNAARQQQ